MRALSWLINKIILRCMVSKTLKKYCPIVSIYSSFECAEFLAEVTLTNSYLYIKPDG